MTLKTRQLYEKVKLFFSGFKRDSRGRLFMDIWDKVGTTEILGDERERHCPPHHLPHSLQIIQPKVCDEPCHIHQTDWRTYLHHDPYCRRLECPNYEDMKKARNKYKEGQNKQ